MKPLTFGSLFAGIGGFDLGFERAGMVCKWQVEIDPYCQKVLAKHWPDVRRWDDVRTWPQPDTEPVDVICGGFPCQDISTANIEWQGLDGDRSGLFFEAVRVVKEMQPAFVVLENVAALLTRGMDRVLWTLAEVGYDAEWHCIPASAVGLPHERQRAFIIAYASSEGRERPVAHNGTPFRKEKTFPVDRNSRPEQWLRMVASRTALRSGDGVSCAMERRRIKGLGNAVVPQVAEWIGRRIVEAVG